LKKQNRKLFPYKKNPFAEQRDSFLIDYLKLFTKKINSRFMFFLLCGSAPLREIVARKDAEAQSLIVKRYLFGITSL
jgi:hypothetical protein